MATTTAVCASFKVELLESLHCFLATQSSLAGAGVSGQFTITGLASTVGLAVGMAAAGTNVAAGAIVASVDSGTQVTVSKAHTGTVTSGTISFTGDVFKFALIKVAPTGTYGSGSTNYTNITGNSDEVSGAGYTATGFALTQATPTIISGVTATLTYSPNPSWTSATISTTAGMIYNTSAGRSGTAGRSVSTHDFGGTQSVTAGTLTAVMPSNTASTAILQVA